MKLWKCLRCKRIFESEEPPTPCPICKAGEEEFVEITATDSSKWKCNVCGAIFEGDEPPVPCPVCKAGLDAFTKLEPKPVAKPSTKWKCTVCGAIFEGEEPPVPCPICKAGKEAFVQIEEASGKPFYKDTDDRFVIVGGGFAALEAAKAIRERNATASITIVAGEIHCPYNRPALSDVLARDHTLESLLLEPLSYYSNNNITILTGVMAESIDPNAQTVLLSTGETLPYTGLLLATGANPFNPIRQEPGAIKVEVLRSFEDAQTLVKDASGKRVVLVGGGILGLEAALALRQRNSQVTVVEFAPRILSRQVDKETSARLQKHLEMLGIRIITGNSVVCADADGVMLEDGTQMAADVVLASMGVRSEVSLASSVNLKIDRGIQVDSFMHTSRYGIWAAGDCAEHDGIVLAVAGAASAMGKIAGASMAGDETNAYIPFTPATYFNAEGFCLLSVGNIAPTPCETVLYQDEENGIYNKLFLQQNTLVGALFVGGKPKGAAIIDAVSKNVTAREALLLLAP